MVKKTASESQMDRHTIWQDALEACLSQYADLSFVFSSQKWIKPAAHNITGRRGRRLPILQTENVDIFIRNNLFKCQWLSLVWRWNNQSWLCDAWKHLKDQHLGGQSQSSRAFCKGWHVFVQLCLSRIYSLIFAHPRFRLITDVESWPEEAWGVSCLWDRSLLVQMAEWILICWHDRRDVATYENPMTRSTTLVMERATFKFISQCSQRWRWRYLKPPGKFCSSSVCSRNVHRLCVLSLGGTTVPYLHMANLQKKKKKGSQ